MNPSPALGSSARVHTSLVATLLILNFYAATAQSALSTARDWSKAPAIVVACAPGDIFALGDVHGDYARLVHLLKQAGIIHKESDIPAEIKWAAGDAVLVCTGDLIDKGNQSLKVLAALRILQHDAERTGGRVIVTMGNHEAEFLAHPENKKDAEFLDELNAAGLDPRAVAEGNDPDGLGAFLRDLPIAARVDGWFFAHAGNTKGLSITGLRDAIEEGVNREGFAAPILSDEDSLIEARLHDHPWWEMAGDARGEGERRLRDHVGLLGASHLVIGHQPGEVRFADGAVRRKGELFMAYDGLLFLVDVGMSSAIDHSKGAILQIHGRNPARATVIDHQGKTSRLWTEK